ncbi:MAG: hypothetical protein JO110_18405 [Acetobacteraceae bacterium]|nr:hypothetical protein [Acetobacteraceae bacterium]
MRRWALSTALIVLLAGPALAQTPPGGSTTPGGAPPGGPPGVGGPGPEHGMPGHHPPGWGGEEREEHEEHWPHHMMMHSKAAIFRLHRGDSTILVKCADDEPTQACVNAAITLLDKVRQSEGHQGAGQSSGQQGPGAPPKAE